MKKSRLIALFTSVMLIISTLFMSVPAFASTTTGTQTATRLGGANRYEVAANIATTYFKTASTVILVNGADEKLADGLAATPLAKAYNAPILLTAANSIPTETQAALDTIKPSSYIIIGGPASVSDSIKTSLGATRIGGADRYEVATNVAEALKAKLGVTSFSNAVITNGAKFADALAAAPFAAKASEPVLFVTANTNDSATKATIGELGTLGITTTDAIGGSASIPDSVVTAVKGTRVNGATREDLSVAIASKYASSPVGVYAVNGYKPADALAIGPLAATTGYPVLYVNSDVKTVKAAVTDYVTATTTIRPENVVAVGGTASVSDAQQNTVITAATPVALAVSSVTAVNGKTVVIKFTRPVLKSTVVTTSGLLNNITFTAIGTAPVVSSANAAASLSEDGKTLTITPQSNECFGGDYAVLVPAAVTDVDGNAIVAYSAIATLNDKVRPTVSVSYTTNNSAHFTFSEPINVTDATAVEDALSIKDDTGATVSPTGLVTLASDKASFDLNIVGWHADKNYTVTLVGLADFNGNLITPNPTTLTVKNSTIDSIAPTVVSIVPTSLTTMKVTFSEPLKATSGVIATYTIDGGTTPINIDTTASTGNASLDSTNTVATITGIAGITTDGIHSVKIDTYSDLSGNAGTATTKLVSFTADTVAPAYVSSKIMVDGSDQYLYITYSEPVKVVGNVNALTGTYVDANSITKTMSPILLANASNVTDASGNPTNTIKVKITGLTAGTYTVTTDSDLVDDLATPANSAAPATISFAFGTYTDPTVPTISNIYVQKDITGVTATEDTVYVLFSMPVNSATALNPANYTVEGQQVFNKAIFDGDAQTVKLTLKPNVFTVSGNRLFTIQNVATAAGKVMAASATTQLFTENVKPTITSAAFTDATHITVTFSENVTVTGTSDFEFYIDGVKQAAVANDAIAGNKTLTITVPSITDLSKAYQIKYVGSDVKDTATPSNTAVSGVLVTVTH